MTGPSYIHLRIHTEYSLSEGLIRIPQLIEQAVKIGMPAIAVTDKNNLFATVKFYQAAIKAGVKPIIGADFCLENEKGVHNGFSFTLLCQSEQGYRNLITLMTTAFLSGYKTEIPYIRQEWLKGKTDGLIMLSGGLRGDIGQALLAKKELHAKALLEKWINLFQDRFYLELQRTDRAHEEFYLQTAVQFARIQCVPVVATNDVCFLKKEDFDAHEARVCIYKGYILSDSRRPRDYSNTQYLRTPQEMEVLFSDIPEALENSVEIAKRCNVELHLGKTFLPKFPIPSLLSAEDYLIQEAQRGLELRLSHADFDKNPLDLDVSKIPTFEAYRLRLTSELKVINSMGFASYFLIVADFIRWAKEQEIPVGPGRGSGAGSLVAYALQITDLDPLQYDLLFERFLNPERVSLPDFDIDFCMDGRDKVIQYVSERYGKEAVSQIITYGSLTAKAVIRDVGRVLGYPYGMVDKIAKLIPFELGITLQKALNQEDRLREYYENEEEIKILIDLAKALEGLVKNAGKHAGGVVIAPSKLTDFTPLYYEPGELSGVTQFDKDDIEKVGLVKFDFLGLRTLTIIKNTVKTINQKRSSEKKALLDINHILLNDAATYTLLKNCKTAAVFQLESRGMRDLIKRLQPDCLADIIALVALFRPGPLQSGMVDDFIDRKHKRARVEYPHLFLEKILGSTYGIILYQEQVMEIAQVLAGYTLGSADLLRRAMGKKKIDEMAQQRHIFILGAKDKGVSQEVASHIFDLMEKFADYGFNKSHSAAYALVSYQTAWLKTHYPAEFMAAVLSSDMDHTDKVVTFLQECKAMKLTILPPDINQSYYEFRVNEKKEILYGLGAIKGVGAGAIDNIVMERGQKGNFTNLFEFCQRIEVSKINRRALEALIHSGSLDILGLNRATLLGNLEQALQRAEQYGAALASNQQQLFAMPLHLNFTVKEIAESPLEQRLQEEKGVLGFYLSGHPLQKYAAELKRLRTVNFLDLEKKENQMVLVGGWVSQFRTLFTKRGDRMAILTLEDHHGRLELTVFGDIYTTYRDLLAKDKLLLVEGEVQRDDMMGNIRLIAKRILDIAKAREFFAKSVTLRLGEKNFPSHFPALLKEKFSGLTRGDCPVYIDYVYKGVSVKFPLGKAWYMKPSEGFIQTVIGLLGPEGVVIDY